MDVLMNAVDIFVRSSLVAIELEPAKGEVTFIFCVELDKKLVSVDIFRSVDSLEEDFEVSLG
jgi:hypothetical protein